MNIDIKSLELAINTGNPEHLAGAFVWASTPEGHEFWKTVEKFDKIPLYAHSILCKMHDDYQLYKELTTNHPSLVGIYEAITNQILQLSVIRDKILVEHYQYITLQNEWENENYENIAGNPPADPHTDSAVLLLEDALRNLEDAQDLAKRWRQK